MPELSLYSSAQRTPRPVRALSTTESAQDACALTYYFINPGLDDQSVYSRAYANYILTWARAVPLNAIVLAQSPYPNDIYPSTAAAMSFDASKCRSAMRMDVPPTVAVLANDLYINSGVPREHTIEFVADGWKRVDDGILLVNEAVLQEHGTAASFREGVAQCDLLVRLLRDTEGYGKRTVEIFCLGAAGQRMGNNITTWFKSSVVKLTKRSVVHPASMSYKYRDLQCSECHLSTPSFSRALSKYVSNCVATSHTMAPQRKTEAELRVASALNLIEQVAAQLTPLSSDATNLAECGKALLETMPSDTPEEYRDALQRFTEALNAMSSRVALTSSLTQGAISGHQSVSLSMGRPGPSLSAVSPSSSVVSGHTGKAPTSLSNKPPKVTPVKLGSKSNITATPVKLKLSSSSGAVATSTQSTAASGKSDIPAVSKVTPVKLAIKPKAVNVGTPPKMGAVSVQPTKVSLSSKNYEKSPIPADGGSDANPQNQGATMSKEIKYQLSSFEAVVEMLFSRMDSDPESHKDYEFIMSSVRDDLKSGTTYNDYTKRLIKCLAEDMKANKEFEFVQCAVDDKYTSTAYDECVNIFFSERA